MRRTGEVSDFDNAATNRDRGTGRVFF